MESHKPQCDCDKCSKNAKMNDFLSIMSKMMGQQDPKIQLLQNQVSNSLNYHQKTLQKTQEAPASAIDPMKIYDSQPHPDFNHIPYNTNFFLPVNFEKFILTGQYSQFLLPEVASHLENAQQVFITGCGRSGTTLLFKILTDSVSQDQMLALNEPRELYLNALGSTFDIWSSKSPIESEICPKATAKLDQILSDLMKPSKTCYIEKMPEHIFRIPELLTILPDSKFIFMKRNWLEVALSIERFGSSSNWYGYKSVKWSKLIKFLAQKDYLSKRFEGVKFDTDNLFVRGVIEWLMCELQKEEMLLKFKDSLLVIDYADVIGGRDSLLRVCEDIERFTGLQVNVEESLKKIEQPRNDKMDLEDVRRVLLQVGDDNQEEMILGRSMESGLLKNLRLLRIIVNEELLKYLIDKL